jgi:hypothetical protein
LENDPLKERDIQRYLYYLKKGEKDRKWLLQDMMFSDPYKDAVDKEGIEQFEAMSKKYLGTDKDEEEAKKGTESSQHQANNSFAEDEDPEWFQKKFPHLR